ncbi:GIY-YIG nuclease family protein [Candidatus Shapirobacteria bacterium]|jgi:excinuclease ABC subunit C|nr:GIY-YIG nuclease family protein [Candidatus Shapirobacteria bacterium]
MIDFSVLPESPGVYIYRNSMDEIIYVGKAINLKNRISQYFLGDNALGPKTKVLVSQIYSVETKTVNSEIEALILEASLIKKYHPKYNSLLKDDRSYLYICITKEKIPRIFTAHSSNLPPKAAIYGPFPDASAAKSLLKTIRNLFPYRGKENHPKVKCLYCHLGLCPGPNPDPKIYNQNILKIKKILNGKITSLLNILTKEMKIASKSQDYELALKIKRQIDSLNYITSGWQSLKSMFENINLPDDKNSQAIDELQAILKPYFSIKKINRFEVYDISQLGNNYFVGSMVVWQNGYIDKSQYKKFKIKSKQIPDDQFMLREVVSRRLRHHEWDFPDLIVVDGGKPQVSSVSQITNLPIIGLAKKEETIVIKGKTKWVDIILPKYSKALLLLENLRNEAHRFANSYRKQLISRAYK